MNWFLAPYYLFFKGLAVLVRIYMTNRAWLEKKLAGKSAAGSVKGIVLITILVWFFIWFKASDENQNSFTQAWGSLLSEFGIMQDKPSEMQSEQKKP